MSSDREKAEQRDCLAVLAEVEQYILQGKRDPKKVAEYMQPIIGTFGKLLFASGNDRVFLDEVKEKTTAGKFKWWYVNEDCMSTEIMEDGIYYNIISPSSKFLTGNTYFRIFAPPNGSLRPAYTIDLNEDDKFFFMVLLKNLEKKHAEDAPTRQ